MIDWHMLFLCFAPMLFWAFKCKCCGPTCGVNCTDDDVPDQLQVTLSGTISTIPPACFFTPCANFIGVAFVLDFVPTGDGFCLFERDEELSDYGPCCFWQGSTIQCQIGGLLIIPHAYLAQRLSDGHYILRVGFPFQGVPISRNWAWTVDLGTSKPTCTDFASVALAFDADASAATITNCDVTAVTAEVDAL